MTRRARPSLALAAVLSLAACGSSTPRTWAPPRAASAGAGLPGVDLPGLEAGQRRIVEEWAEAAYPYCGAPRTVAESLRKGGCRHASRMVRLAARLVGAGFGRERLDRAVTDYYASFDPRKRASLDVASFGPPLGEPGAPVALVEFSDFTCPACQMVRPGLERFVTDRPGRVRLHFKPYAIETHVNSLEAAQAAEWARDQGAFWKMHDTLFDNPYAYEPESLVSYAVALGLDGGDLAAALKAERYVPKVRASMAEARAAGLTGTPTIFLNGRLHRLSLSDDDLEFALEDEEEWVRNSGWGRD